MSPTPAGVTITATRPDGTTVDVTEGVQALYDLVIQSMDWGSGMLSVEEVEPIAVIANFCGFGGFEEAQKYLDAERRAEVQRKCPHPDWRELEPDPRGTVFCECESCGVQRFLRYDR